MKWKNISGYFSRRRTADLCFCTLAIHQPYRDRARLLCADLHPSPMVVLTDEPGDFADLRVRAIRHVPTGPMARDYLEKLPATGNHRGAAAYHDKRFALRAALEDHATALFLDADARLESVPIFARFSSGLSVTKVVRRSVREHLNVSGSWRLSAFERLAVELVGSTDALQQAWWCHEACLAITKDGRADRFFEAWGRAADIMQGQNVFSGEGGVIGLAALCAGWPVEFERLAPMERLWRHEGGGPKRVGTET